MKRWEVKVDGANAGHVYADTADAARRAAHAAFKRVRPDQDPAGRLRVGREGEELESEAKEAQAVISQVYEGLRLLPGMEAPAEKLRNALLLIESSVARDSMEGVVGASRPRGGGGGDTELQEALQPLLDSKCVPSQVKARLKGLAEWVGLNTPEAERRKVEVKLFQALWESGLIDFRLDDEPTCELHKPGAFLVRRLVRAGDLRVERFDGVRNLDELREALAPFRVAAEQRWSFVRPREGPAGVTALRPLVLFGERVLQKARFMRGVSLDDEEAVALDQALFDVRERLALWNDGLGRLADPFLKDTQRQLFTRTEKRIHATRTHMANAVKEGGDVLPPATARRDLTKFVLDQIYRIEDALAHAPPDRSLRAAFGELVFKDVVFRSAGAYLSQRCGIQIDTEVVEGADTEGLVGRFKKEVGGPKPTRKSRRIHSVVVPCYLQDGTAIRPASVRVGDYA
ncbi:MAG: hypothetical protein KDD82_07710 [Planctomycetes bacterium]|nr:hypothetical protein [Planctomycetota bacterium]